MTIEGPEPGTVFFYRYLWGHEEDNGVQNPKDRTVSCVFKAKDQKGIDHLVIAPISDLKPDNDRLFIAVPEIEQRRGGLDIARPAFIHIGEFNYDPMQVSWNYDPTNKVLGRFSKPFTKLIVAKLAANLKRGAARKINRFPPPAPKQ